MTDSDEGNLSSRLRGALTNAMRQHNKICVSTIRMALAELQRAQLDKQSALNEDEMIAVLGKMIKQRTESIKQYRQANRNDLADNEESEIQIIRQFIPTIDLSQMTQLIDDAIQQTAAVSIKDMGKVMQHLKSAARGHVDMSAVSMAVKEKLSLRQ